MTDFSCPADSTPVRGALFIDLENIRYSLHNVHQASLDVAALYRHACAHVTGHFVEAAAYGDFSRHEDLKWALEVAGIRLAEVPLYRCGGREKSSADIALTIDALETALDHPDIDTFVLVTGDRDFMRLCTRLRHRFGKRIVVIGVASTTALDLIAVADVYDPLPVPPLPVPPAPIALPVSLPAPSAHPRVVEMNAPVIVTREAVGAVEESKAALTPLQARGLDVLLSMDDDCLPLPFFSIVRYLHQSSSLGLPSMGQARALLSALVAHGVLRQERTVQANGIVRKVLRLDHQQALVQAQLNWTLGQRPAA